MGVWLLNFVGLISGFRQERRGVQTPAGVVWGQLGPGTQPHCLVVRGTEEQACLCLAGYAKVLHIIYVHYQLISYTYHAASYISCS